MNRQGKKGIEWTDWSWNVITGCKHGCWYCYARKLCLRFRKIFPNGFEPTFYEDRLTEPWELQKPSKIFVCSISDLFAPWTPKEWRNKVLMSMFVCPTPHIFQMLTKNPERIPKPKKRFPDTWWFGTTVTGENDDAVNIDAIKQVPAKVRFVSFEPLLGEIDFDKHSLEGIQWVIIGKLTGSRRVPLKNSWVIDIMEEARFHQIPVFQKNNLGFQNPRQEFPA